MDLTKWATVAAVAVLVLVLARGVRADDPAKGWDYLPGYKPGSGYYL